MSDYQTRRSKADVYLPAQLRILSAIFAVPLNQVTTADDVTDRTQATDAIVGGKRIALRVRDSDQLRYKDEFTIRTSRGIDGKSELDKIKSNAADLMLYGFGENGDVFRWNLINLAVVAHFARDDFQCIRHEKGRGLQSEFVALRYASFPPYPPIVLASSHPSEIPTPDRDQCECWRSRNLARLGIVAPILADPPAAAPEQPLPF